MWKDKRLKERKPGDYQSNDSVSYVSERISISMLDRLISFSMVINGATEDNENNHWAVNAGLNISKHQTYSRRIGCMHRGCAGRPSACPVRQS